MKACSAVMLLIIVGFAMPSTSKAQVSVYAEGTASNLPNGPAGDYLYGGTLGVTYDGPTLMKHVLLSADIQTRYVDKDGERLIGALLGPRFSFPLKKIRVTPSGEFLVGFARYRDTTLPGALNTTDNEWQTGGGVAKEMTPHLDALVHVDYARYGAEDGKYNPISYSAGVAWHFVKR